MNAEMSIRVKSAHAKFEKLSRKKIKSKQHFCLYKNCNLRAISSHSQQKGGQLKLIHENKKVYALNDNACNVFNAEAGEMQFDFKLKPISQASTYPGLCNKHDTEIFYCIENESLENITNEQAAVFLYRAISYESYRKKRELERTKFMLKELDLYLSSFQIKQLEEKLIIDNDYFENTTRTMMFGVNSIIDNKEYEKVNFIHKKIDRNVGISCTTMVNMYLERYLEFWSGNAEDSIPAFSFTLVPNDNSTHVVFSWLKSDDDHTELMKTYINEKFELFLNRLIFCESEDICIKPSVWESFSETLKDKIISSMHHVLTRGRLYDEMVPIVIKL